MEHDQYCNCEDCWWARGQKLVCSVCVCDEDSCPHSLNEKVNLVTAEKVESDA